ncbi:MAG: MarR family transcriptional regulator [Lachnospiraceae bacterium]|nr:MarR family transcriptional regulator [Lachnospiraceae bacterium]
MGKETYAAGDKEARYDCLKLENQLCFPLYACSKEVVRHYKTFLDALDLTYTQYITMMVLWEKKEMNVKEIGKNLYLDSGTLTPLLKKLESKGYIKRHRSKEDERNLIISITPAGEALKDRALEVPEAMSKCICIGKEKTEQLYGLLYELLEEFEKAK